jgi:hypothetical protein
VEMLDVFAQRTSQRALTEQNHLGQALFLYRSHPAFRIGIQVRTARREAIGLPSVVESPATSELDDPGDAGQSVAVAQ